jgi:ribosomal RNA assembly protein
METIFFENTSKIKKNLKLLQEKLNIKITLKGKQVTIEGSSMDEYEAEKILDAINFGFTARKALLLTDPDMEFRKMNIKKYTRRKNLTEVKARIIGTKGKTKRVLSDISGCDIIVKENTVGILGPTESVGSTTTALANLIKGTKIGNVFKYLERTNRLRKEKEENLGLK